jgi:hypothetical protein
MSSECSDHQRRIERLLMFFAQQVAQETQELAYVSFQANDFLT